VFVTVSIFGVFHKWNGGDMKRFLLLILSLVVIISLFTACQHESNGEGAGADQSKELYVLLPEHPYANILISLLSEFESENDIKVIVEQLSEGEITELQVDAIDTDSFVADVFMTRPMTETLNFLKNDWMLPLDGYDMSDYPSNTLEIGIKDGKPYFVPLIVEWNVLYYRKDLLRAAGLDVPSTLEEMEEAAMALNKGGVAGFASRGAGSPSVSQISSYIFNFGGRFIENGVAAFDSPEAVEAITFYGKLLGMTGPNGVAAMTWSDIIPIFQAGNLAMWTDASVFYSQLIDPEVSQIPAENVGVASFPRGPVSDEPYIMTSWGMSISSKTEDVDSAMAFLNWATGVEIAKSAMLDNIPMARTSVWNDTSITANINPEIVETMIHASQNGYPYALPLMTSIVQARELIGDVISESINTSGTSPRLQNLATQKAAEVNELLKADGEYGLAR